MAFIDSFTERDCTTALKEIIYKPNVLILHLVHERPFTDKRIQRISHSQNKSRGGLYLENKYGHLHDLHPSILCYMLLGRKEAPNLC